MCYLPAVRGGVIASIAVTGGEVEAAEIAGVMFHTGMAHGGTIRVTDETVLVRLSSQLLVTSAGRTIRGVGELALTPSRILAYIFEGNDDGRPFSERRTRNGIGLSLPLDGLTCIDVPRKKKALGGLKGIAFALLLEDLDLAVGLLPPIGRILKTMIANVGDTTDLVSTFTKAACAATGKQAVTGHDGDDLRIVFRTRSSSVAESAETDVSPLPPPSAATTAAVVAVSQIEIPEVPAGPAASFSPEPSPEISDRSEPFPPPAPSDDLPPPVEPSPSVLRSDAVASDISSPSKRSTNRTKITIALMLIAAIVAVAVFVSRSNDSDKASNGTTPPSVTVAGSDAVSASGSTVNTPLGVRVDIPAGALSGDGFLNVRPTALPGDIGDALALVGPIVDIELSQTTQLAPIQVTLPITDPTAFDPVIGPDGQQVDVAPALIIVHFVGQRWEALDTTVDRATSTASARTDSLSPLGIAKVVGTFLADTIKSAVEALTSDVLSFVPTPTCDGADDFSNWEAAPANNPVSWCAGLLPDGTSVVQVANRRRYAVTVSAPQGSVTASSTKISAQLSALTVTAGTVVVAPGEVADITFPPGVAQRVTVTYDGLAQAVSSIMVAAQVLAEISAHLPFGNPKTASEILNRMDLVACMSGEVGGFASGATSSVALIAKLISSCITKAVVGAVLAGIVGTVAAVVAYSMSSAQALFDLIIGGANGTLTRTSTPVPPTTPVTPTTTPIAEAGALLPLEAWTPVGQTIVIPAAADGSFTLQAVDLYWSGLRASTDLCDYRFSGDGRTIGFSGYGFVARTEFTADGAPVNGHGIQYDPESGGYRDTEYPEIESSPITSAPTDKLWHHVAIEVQGSTYRSFVDGALVYEGTTDSPCGDLYLRVWRASSEFRNLRLEPLAAVVETQPVITSVTTVQASNVQNIVITGSGFGTHAPFDGDLPCIELTDVTANWEAGHLDVAGGAFESFGPCSAPGGRNDLVTLTVSQWTDTSIQISGLSGGYGNLSAGWVLSPGDEVVIQVANAQTGAGPAKITTTVGAVLG